MCGNAGASEATPDCAVTDKLQKKETKKAATKVNYLWLLYEINNLSIPWQPIHTNISKMDIGAKTARITKAYASAICHASKFRLRLFSGELTTEDIMIPIR